jgi:hypothetical protein
MPKRSYESGALVGFDIVVPSSSPSIGRARPAEAAPVEPDAPPSGGYEDTWYRTLRVIAGASRGDDLEREGGLGDADAGVEPEDLAAPPVAVATVTPLPVTVIAAPGGDEGPAAPSAQASPDSYEDSWYQILKSRRAAGDAGI